MEQIILASFCLLLYLFLKFRENKPNKITYYAKFTFYYVYLLIMLIIVSFVLIWRGRNTKNSLTLCKYMSPLLRFNGKKWHVENFDVLKTKESAVIISNHQHALDLLGFIKGMLTIGPVVCIAKKELLYYGPFGLVLYLVGVIFLDRKKTKEAYSILTKLAEDMKKDKLKVWVFPEGTRNYGKSLLPFKKGAFTLAVYAQVPIIPVVYSPYYFIDDAKYIFNYGGHVTMQCLAPVPTAGLTMDDVPELQERLHRIISDAYVQLTQKISTHSEINLPGEHQ